MTARGSSASGVHTSQAHDAAVAHVTGTATYIDDMAEPHGTLHAALVLSPHAHGRIRSIDFAPAQAIDGVRSIVAARDIPGRNDIAPVFTDEPLFAETVVSYAGQPVAAIAADTMDIARRAAAAVKLDIEPLAPILTITDAVAQKSYLRDPMIMQTGDAAVAIASAPHTASGRFAVGGQEHFYLETQVAFAYRDDSGDLVIHSSTQSPTEVQHVCARVLGRIDASVVVNVRRMGGGFGGKETNATAIAVIAALLAEKSRRPVKLRLPRETDMVTTGKRHPFDYSWSVGFDDDGRVLGLDVTLAADGGHVTDMTIGVMTRALAHVDNAYFIPALRATGLSCRTNFGPHTAFRGFGGPQGVVVMEEILGHIATRLGLDVELVRSRNFYSPERGETTPYGQKVHDNVLENIVSTVLEQSDFKARRTAIELHNENRPFLRRGIGLMPLKFGMAFNAIHLNQAGASVMVYADGTVRLGHGGTEMGQGLFVKVAQVVASVFGIGLDRIRLTTTSTAQVPNTSATAASTGSDLNGWAAYNAASALRGRMAEIAAAHFGVDAADVEFVDDHVRPPHPGTNRALHFSELARMCYRARVSLSEAGFYKTPDITWDPVTLKGSPYPYFSYGAAVAEVEIDTLTGALRVTRADIVQDCGKSLNPAIDLGQIEGGFVQGMGWLTCEALHWDSAGRLRTKGPSTYKIPGSRDAPEFNVCFFEKGPTPANTVFRSKGVGEPPLMLSVAIWNAAKHALAGLADADRLPVRLGIPMTPDAIIAEIDRLTL